MKNILCFGDSNTWGYNPNTKGRYEKSTRWTGILQDRLAQYDVHIIEEGACGRTTVYEDKTRPNLKGIDTLPALFRNGAEIDSVVLMLGTNDCKTYNRSTPQSIAEGIERCLDEILTHVSAKEVLLISPILLGEHVWEEGFDPDFDRNSVNISRGLKQEYRAIAKKRGVRFLAASDYVLPSQEDQEHLSAGGHLRLAEVIYNDIVGSIA